MEETVLIENEKAFNEGTAMDQTVLMNTKKAFGEEMENDLEQTVLRQNEERFVETEVVPDLSEGLQCD